MPRKKQLNIVLILDASGSMDDIKTEAIKAFNSYIETQRKDNPSARLALVVFNSSNIDIQSVKPVAEVELLTEDTYRPDMMTPLYDAIGKALTDTEKRVTQKAAVIVVILTDGYENFSREYTRDAIFKKIEDKEADGWAFVYLGAGHDTFAAAGAIGIPASNVLTYDLSRIISTSGAMSRMTAQYTSSGQTKGLNAVVDKDDLLDSPTASGGHS